MTKGEELVELAQSIQLFHKSLDKFTEWLTESERHLNSRKSIPRRFALFQTLLKQVDEQKVFQAQLDVYKEHFIDLNKLATHLQFVSPKSESIYVKNSLLAVQTRWQRIVTRSTERNKELQKTLQQAKKVGFHLSDKVEAMPEDSFT